MGAKKNIRQEDRILDHLETYGYITQLDALREYGIMRLASRISDLRNEGYDIETTYEVSKNRYGEKVKFAKYVWGARHGV